MKKVFIILLLFGCNYSDESDKARYFIWYDKTVCEKIIITKDGLLKCVFPQKEKKELKK